MKEERVGLDKGMKYFSQAASNFKKVKHLFGAYLAKRRESEMMDNYQNCLPLWERSLQDKKKKDKDRVRADMNKYHKKWENYLYQWKDKWE